MSETIIKSILAGIKTWKFEKRGITLFKAECDIISDVLTEYIAKPETMASPSADPVENKNAELVEELEDLRRQFTKNGTIGLHVSRYEDIINALSQPKPFDVLAHLREGGLVMSFDSDDFYYELLEGDVVEYPVEGGFPSPMSAIFLINHEFKPYEPEPTPQDILEKARSSMNEAFGTAAGTEIDNVNAALDVLQKLINDK